MIGASFLIIKTKYEGILTKISCNLDDWSSLTNTYCFHYQNECAPPYYYFMSSMLPLPPLSPFWDRLQSIITKFVWNGGIKGLYTFEELSFQFHLQSSTFFSFFTYS